MDSDGQGQQRVGSGSEEDFARQTYNPSSPSCQLILICVSFLCGDVLHHALGNKSSLSLYGVPIRFYSPPVYVVG